MQVKEDSQIIKAASKGYNYNYASLADIAKAGKTIPKMRVKPTENGDYIEYLDEAGEWQIGAKIVIPEMAKSNEAQKYGAAVTYARRVTAQLALSLVCSDDDKVETHTEEDAKANEKRNASRPSFDDIKSKLDTLKTIAAINDYAKTVSELFPNPTDKQRHAIQTMFTIRREELTEARSTYHASN
jgi:hypothetical protein